MFGVAVNWWAVIVSGIILMVLGAVWYSPFLFAKPWMRVTGRKMSEVGSPNVGYAIAMIANLIIAYVLAVFVDKFGATTASQGMMVAFWLWFGFTASASAMNYVFEGKSIQLYAINMGQQLVGMLIIGGILATWH